MKNIKSIEVVPSSNIFEQLGNGNSNFVSMIAELIDNPLAEASDGQCSVSIDILGPWGPNNNSLDLKKAFVIVKDDAKGIPLAVLPKALSPAALAQGNADSLHEHGMGMKNAIASIGELKTLTTKTLEDRLAYQINKLKFGTIPVEEVVWDVTQGTEIIIKNLKACVPYRKEDFTTRVIPHLGAKYRLFLDHGNANVNLSLRLTLRDLDGEIKTDVSGKEYDWTIEPVYPRYQNEDPKVDKYLTGKDWAARVKFGFAPSLDEITALGLKRYEKTHPYHPYARTIDIIMHGRVIQHVKLSELDVRYGQGAVLVPALGEVFLMKGFETSFTKDGILNDRNFMEFKRDLDELINPVITAKLDNDKIKVQEAEMIDRIYEHQTKTEDRVCIKQYPIEACGCRVDLLCDNEVWEIKTEMADAQDVYQVLLYVEMSNDTIKKDRARLIAKDFSSGAKETAKFVDKKHGVKIKLLTLDDMNLNYSKLCA